MIALIRQKVNCCCFPLAHCNFYLFYSGSVKAYFFDSGKYNKKDVRSFEKIAGEQQLKDLEGVRLAIDLLVYKPVVRSERFLSPSNPFDRFIF